MKTAWKCCLPMRWCLYAFENFLMKVVVSIPIFFALVFSSSAFPFEEPIWRIHGIRALALTSFDTVDISLIDSVRGGCMARPDAIKRSAEVQLRRNNFRIGDNSTFSVPNLEIAATGFRVQSMDGSNLGCTVHVNVALTVYVEGVPYSLRGDIPDGVGGVLGYDVMLKSTILADGTGSSMQNKIEKNVQEAVDELFLETQRARDLLDKHFPGALELHR